MADTNRKNARRRWALVAVSVALVLHGVAGFPTPGGPEPESATAHPQRDCIDEFWGEPMVPPYCYDVPHEHAPTPTTTTAPPTPTTTVPMGGQDCRYGTWPSGKCRACPVGSHTHGSGCHSTSDSHEPDPGEEDPDPGDTPPPGDGDNEQGCSPNYVDKGNGCEINYQPDPETATCPEETTYDPESQLCVGEDPTQDPDVPDKKRTCPSQKEWWKDGRCQVKQREDDPERSENCPAGQVFYSTIGCAPPCDAGQVLVNGTCQTVREPSPNPQPGNNPPPECPVGYSGTPPNCVRGTPEIYVLATTASEGGGTVEVTVTLSHSGTADATVDVSTSDGTATAGIDYTAVTSQSVTIASGTQTATVSITILDDTAYDPDETFQVTASNAAGGAVLGTNPSADVTITDNDQPSLSISGPSRSANEGGSLRFTVSLTRPQGHTDAVSVDYAASSTTATESPAGQGCSDSSYDYAVAEGTLSWGGTESGVRRVVVDACADTVHPESDEMLTVTLSNPTTGVLLTSDSADGTIRSVLEPPGPVTNLRAVCSGGQAEANWSAPTTGGPLYQYSDGWAHTLWTSPSTQYVQMSRGSTRNRWSSIADGTYTVNVSTRNSAGSATASTSMICGSAQPTVSVSDASGSEDEGFVDFTVSLSASSGSAVSVDVATSDGTATAGSDYTAVSRTVGISSGRTAAVVRVPVLADSTDEPSETFTLTLSTPVGATLGTSTATGTITDTDASVPTLNVSDATANESDGTADFTVTMSRAANRTVTVTVTTSDGTATAGSDYTAVTARSYVIAPGATTATASVPITDDTDDEPDETFTLTLSSPTGATLGTSAATGTITDNDYPAMDVSFGQASYTATEGGTAATVTVTLSAAPTRTVTVPIADTPAGGAIAADYSGVPASVIFGASEASKTFTVTATDDTDDDDLESVDLAFGSLPAGVSAGTVSAATVSIVDNDGVTVVVPTVSVSDVAVAEPAGTADFTVTLSAATSVAVTVDVATSDGTATAGSDYTAVTRTVSIAAGSTSATVSVPITDDSIQESHETFTLTLSSPANAALGTASATGTIVDDESPPPIYR